jgi:hypothetical protein
MDEDQRLTAANGLPWEILINHYDIGFYPLVAFIRWDHYFLP